jgi:Uma2 family endonuclease
VKTQATSRHFTPKEYLELETKAEYKSEYRDGKIVPMIGGTTNHNEIAGNFYAHLKFGLRSKNYRVYFSDVRLWIPHYRQYTYPDVMVIQGEPVYSEPNTTTVMNPVLIIEVLSKSTQNYDQGDKFSYYRSIPEMQEYILVSQHQFHVMQHIKIEEGKWLLTDYRSEDSILKINSVDFDITIRELYSGVNFEESEE